MPLLNKMRIRYRWYRDRRKRKIRGLEVFVMRNICWAVVVLFLLVCGCGGGSKPKLTPEEMALIPLPQKTELPEVSGPLLVAVGNETISSDEVVEPLTQHFKSLAQTQSYEQFSKGIKPQVKAFFLSKASGILLYNKAKKQAGEQIDAALEKAVESEVRKFVLGFNGDYAKAEKALEQEGIDWEKFREYQKKMLLSQSYIAQQLPDPKPVTRGELMGYYEKMKNELFTTEAKLKFQLIDIQPGKLEVADANQSRTEQAAKLAGELIRRIEAGEDFAKLAEQYSYGHRRIYGGLWKSVQPESLAEPYDVLAVEAEKINAGEVAGPIEVDQHIFIMKVIEKQANDVKPFEEVQKEIENKINLQRRKDAWGKVSADIIERAGLANNDRFVDYCVKEIYERNNL